MENTELCKKQEVASRRVQTSALRMWRLELSLFLSLSLNGQANILDLLLPWASPWARYCANRRPRPSSPWWYLSTGRSSCS